MNKSVNMDSYSQSQHRKSTNTVDRVDADGGVFSNDRRADSKGSLNGVLSDKEMTPEVKENINGRQVLNGTNEEISTNGNAKTNTSMDNSADITESVKL